MNYTLLSLIYNKYIVYILWSIWLTIYPYGYIILFVSIIPLFEGGSCMEYGDQIKNRAKRIEGQVRGILRMMEENKDCKEVITQLSAVRTAIDRTIGVIVSSNLVECVQKANTHGEKSMEKLVKNAVDLLVKSR
jgi:DNA-binding FrmR family transcriptional regulator